MIIVWLIDGLLDGAWTAAAGFFKSAQREREEWLSQPGVATYARKIVRHYEPWPGGPAGERPFQRWPGDRR